MGDFVLEFLWVGVIVGKWGFLEGNGFWLEEKA